MDETKKNFMPAAHPPGWKLNPKYIEPHQTHAAFIGTEPPCPHQGGGGACGAGDGLGLDRLPGGAGRSARRGRFCSLAGTVPQGAGQGGQRAVLPA